MGDIQSGMGSTIIHVYIKQILESFFHHHSQVRMIALSVITLILRQGLVHPVQIVPYLISMGTDSDSIIRAKADQQVQELDKIKAMQGIKMSYRLHEILQQDPSEPIRGICTDDDNIIRLNSFIYSLIRSNRGQRRAMLQSLLNMFDETGCKRKMQVFTQIGSLGVTGSKASDEGPVSRKGFFVTREYEYMLGQDMRELYIDLLTRKEAPLKMRCQVLSNMLMYLTEEEARMIKADQEWKKLQNKEDLKEMGDIQSGMASTIIQVYIKQILESFFHHHPQDVVGSDIVFLDIGTNDISVVDPVALGDSVLAYASYLTVMATVQRVIISQMVFRNASQSRMPPKKRRQAKAPARYGDGVSGSAPKRTRPATGREKEAPPLTPPTEMATLHEQMAVMQQQIQTITNLFRGWHLRQSRPQSVERGDQQPQQDLQPLQIVRMVQ
ncbi:hypothetical protein NP493_933g01007 [Ridgeia piscesae]|uniref:Nipped-B protein n=1 Tax=Ridgeia piscesae TaxID=27915 RepID=A0AAD9KK20_RIDPI|nr:hypothetical protein NP493_933g01007 [Ridgeia piscesae]